jgi:branched-chain amino acid transport system ATP-binding protein
MLELEGIHTYYGESHVLHGVDFVVPASGVAALLGRNGMGKTTTIHTIKGLTPPREGVVRYKGEDITRTPPHRIGRMGIALVPQGRRIFASLTVQENLVVAARRRASSDRPRWTLERVHELFPILKERATVKGQLLSGGEQQMLAIGRALMLNPDLLLLDEPSEGLAPIVIDEIAVVIRELASQDLAILLVEQNLALALSVADDVHVMSKGSVVHAAPAAEFALDDDAKGRYLGAASYV